MLYIVVRHDDNGHSVFVDEYSTALDANQRLNGIKSMDHKQWFEIISCNESERDQTIKERGILV